MKAYFTASLTGKEKFREEYEKIISCLSELGYQILSDHIMQADIKEVKEWGIEEKSKYYKRVCDWIKESDIVVTEVSYPSVNVGHEISLSLEFGKPVIGLYKSGEKPPQVLEGISSQKLLVSEYSITSLKKVINELINEAKEQMDVRFNFFISPKIGAYLDWIAKRKKVPRAVYLRRLIEQDMKKNKEYKA